MKHPEDEKTKTLMMTILLCIGTALLQCTWLLVPESYGSPSFMYITSVMKELAVFISSISIIASGASFSALFMLWIYTIHKEEDGFRAYVIELVVFSLGIVSAIIAISIYLVTFFQ